MVTQPPEIRLVPCKARAVDARLLARTDANDRAAVRIRDTVRLRVLERKRRDDEVGESLVRELRGHQQQLRTTRTNYAPPCF